MFGYVNKFCLGFDLRKKKQVLHRDFLHDCSSLLLTRIYVFHLPLSIFIPFKAAVVYCGDIYVA